MDSFFARNRLSAYLDGELPEPEASEIAAAIERDPELRAEYENLRRSINLLRKAGPVKAPPGFHARVMEKVRDEPHPAGVVVRLQRVFQRIPMEAVALAAAAAIVLMVVQARTERGQVSNNETENSTQQDSLAQLDDASNHAVAPTRSGDHSPQDLAAMGASSPADGEGGSTLDDYEGVQHLALTTNDPKILNKLARLVEGAGEGSGFFGATESTAEPQALEPRVLTHDDGFQRAFIAIPAEREEQFKATLENLGATPPNTQAPYIEKGPKPSASQTVFLIDVIFTPPW